MRKKKVFEKSPLTLENQLQLLAKRNLIIENKAFAQEVLSAVSYYRLSAYFKPFEQLDGKHIFNNNMTFKLIWETYQFDRKLRLLVWDAIERIEVAFRTSLNNHLSIKYGALWYLKKELFSPGWTRGNNYDQKSPRDFIINEIERLCSKKKDEAIAHYYQNYQEPDYPPSWMLIESLAFGAIVNYYNYLADKTDQKAIAKIFDLHPRILSRALLSFRYMRNLCAHHSRVWNRWFLYETPHLKEWVSEPMNPNSFYQQAWLIVTLLAPISPDSHWIKALFELMEEFHEIPFDLMGFPKEWKKAKLWNEGRLKL